MVWIWTGSGFFIRKSTVHDCTSFQAVDKRIFRAKEASNSSRTCAGSYEFESDLLRLKSMDQAVSRAYAYAHAFADDPSLSTLCVV
jgi:hypothetical protein